MNTTLTIVRTSGSDLQDAICNVFYVSQIFCSSLAIRTLFNKIDLTSKKKCVEKSTIGLVPVFLLEYNIGRTFFNKQSTIA